MNAASPQRIADLLVERFAHTPVLVWRDEAGDYRDHLDAVTAELSGCGLDVAVHVVAGNELGIKCRVYDAIDGVDDGGSLPENRRQLVYRTGPLPVLRDNWLLDLEACYGVFTADTAAILIHELSVEGRGVDGVVRDHVAAFAAPGRVEAIAARLIDAGSVVDDWKPGTFADNLRAFLSAEVLGLSGGSESHRLHRIVVRLLQDFVSDSDLGYEALREAGLIDFLWSGCARIYGYSADEPTIAGLSTWMFNQAWLGWPQARNPARIDFERLRDERSQVRLFTALADRAQDDLNIAERLQSDGPSLANLADRDIFPIIDDVIIRELAAATYRRELSPDRVQDIVRSRSTTTWFTEHQHSYAALSAAADCLSRVESFAPVIADATDGVRSYAERWAFIDRAYRTFRHHLVLAETDLPKELSERVERHYVNDYQRALAQAWQTQIDQLETWQIPGIESLNGFARYDLRAKKTKTLVVVSDAFRYEVGAELADRLNADDWFSATIEPRLSPLPSITCLGMAAMLPHSALELIDGGTVRADGLPTAGLAARKALWANMNVAAIDYDGVMDLSAGERGALWSEHDAVVVYHDTIDKTGHKSPHQTPGACVRALEEIERLIKKFGSGKMRASRVLVTADHGFLYQNSDLQPADYLSERAHGENVVADARRHVIGRGLREHPAFTTWTSTQLGLTGDLEVQTPRGIHRLRKQGDGYQYVHGGTSLQEIVVPLVTLVQSRTGDRATKVTVDVNVSTPTITSSTVMVTLLQREIVEGKRRPRELTVGVFAADGTPLSGLRKVVADSTAGDIRDRGMTVELVLNEEAEAHNGETVTIRADEVTNGTNTEYRSTTATLRRGFGGFFDPL